MSAIPIPIQNLTKQFRNVNMDTWSPSRSSMNFQQRDISPRAKVNQLPHQALSGLDMFDPYDRLHQIMLQPHLNWINRPQSMNSSMVQQPEVPHRYRIALDCHGFKPDAIKCEFKEVKPGQHVLKIVGCQEAGKKGTNDWTRHELNRCFELPKNTDITKMVSFLTPDGKLIVEFPLRNNKPTYSSSSSSSCSSAGYPQLSRSRTPVQCGSGVRRSSPTRISPTRFGGASALSPTRAAFGGMEGQQLKIRLPLPEHVSPDKIHVSIKGGDLIMRCEDTNVSNDQATSIHVFLRYTLPDNINVNQLKCVKQDGQLLVTAPVQCGKSFNKQKQQQQFSGLQYPGLSMMNEPKHFGIESLFGGESKKAKKNKNKAKANIISI